MNRPKYEHRPFFVGELHRLIFGVRPGKDEPLRKVMEAVMRDWDYAAVTASTTGRECARIELCQIGMKWHITDNLPFSFEDIARKLAVISPELQKQEVTARTMRHILNRHQLPEQSR